MPPHWMCDWFCTATGVSKKYATVAFSITSGITVDGMVNKLKPTVSSCGMFLCVTCEWPPLLSNLNTLAVGWSTNNKLSTAKKSSMFMSAQLVITGKRSAASLTASQPLLGTARIRLNYEVERKIYTLQMISDTVHGMCLMVVLKEKNKDSDNTEVNFGVSVVDSSTSYGAGGFDLSCLHDDKKARKNCTSSKKNYKDDMSTGSDE